MYVRCWSTLYPSPITAQSEYGFTTNHHQCIIDVRHGYLTSLMYNPESIGLCAYFEIVLLYLTFSCQVILKVARCETAKTNVLSSSFCLLY